MAAKICILNYFLCAIQGEDNKELSATNKELDCIKGVLTDHGIAVEDHMAFKHTVYSNNLISLTITDMPLHQISFALWRHTGNNNDETLDLELSNKDMADNQTSDMESSDRDVADELQYEDQI
ncbi:hypothetical protein PAXINDRAFT_11232 [Paxillus involutus ATCC 200175]|nr:hypothetical protein PAXINDRAFT_11232 [Paxillus involutus ATCC 200175]